MDLRQMEYVVALADEQHFTRAAALCGVSQSGLSAAIRGLEKELGTVLFTRTTRHVEPTDAGHALLPYARELLSRASAGRDAVVRATRALSGHLRVGAEQCLGVVDVPGLLERFHRRYPQVVIQFTQAGSYDLLDLIRAGELDAAFVATPDHLGALDRIELARCPIVVLSPPEHALAAQPRLAWSDLDGLDYVDFHESWAVRSLNDEVCRTHGVHRRVRCTVNDSHTLLDLVHRGLGVAMVPQTIASKPQAADLVVAQLPADAGPEWVVSAVTGPKSAETAAAVHLLELLDIPCAT
ncbi:LysR family transcriptional regulator [Propionicicella superfundia]|uniref:LysR family transcriptional regulator n=1 Tax=Propionicicella superfundia TaxID=348582 RepID=UPI00042395E5|nr:LysR family transcriptional regulator [Propionicicella superfundia]